MRPTLFLGGGQGLDLRELENAPEMQKCPKTFVQDCRMLAGTLPCAILWSMLVIQTQLYIPFLLVLSQIQHVYHQAKMFEQL